MSEVAEEAGRELKVSELEIKTVVVVGRPDKALATLWVRDIWEDSVIFWAGSMKMYFIAHRVGPELEQLADDAGTAVKVYEYLGKV
jgi:hypothetical protein